MIECSYHGWKFDAHTGQCQLIPSLTADQKLKVDRIYAGSYACEEHDDYVWVFIPEPAPAGAGFTKAADAAIARAARPTKFSDKYKIAHLTADLPCSVDHGIIGLMDPAHGPFVHQAWWWRTPAQHSRKAEKFRADSQWLSHERAHAQLEQRALQAACAFTPTPIPSPRPLISCCPILRLETIRAGKYWFSSLTTVTPITRNHCRIDVVACWNFFRWVPFAPELLKFVFAKFVEQDRQTMEVAIRRPEAQSASDAD